MSDQIWKKINYLLSLLTIGALFGVLAVAANLEIKDLDLWLHLTMGKFISQHHFVPDYDVLSCTIAGKPWINHEWLFQVLVYQLFNAFGPDGLLKMQMVVVVLTMLFLYFIGYNKEKLVLTNLFLITVFMVYQTRFTIRPDLFSLLFFAIYIFILALHIDKKWSLVVLFLVQVLWTNMHGFFFFGPLFILIGLSSEWIKRHLPLPSEWKLSGRLTEDEYKRLKAAFILVVLACFFNPAVVDGVLYPLRVLFSLSNENGIFFKHIQELQKPIAFNTLWDIDDMGYYKLLIIFSAVSFIYNRRHIDISALFLWAVFLGFSLIAIRNVSFFAFTAYMVSMANLFSVNLNEVCPIRFTKKGFQYITLIAFQIGMILWLFQLGDALTAHGYYDLDQYKKKAEFGGGISSQGYPRGAVDFLKTNHIRGNFFNDFNSGAYLLGNVYPDIKVFIDGRTEVYGGKFFEAYNRVLKGEDLDLFNQFVRKYHLTGVLLNSSRQSIPKEILNYCYKSKEWILVYFDHDAVIFLKDIPFNKEWIRKCRIDLKKWQPVKIDFLKLGEQRAEPFQPYYRAYTLEALDFDDMAIMELKTALKVQPNYWQAYNLLGKIYAKKKKIKEAFESFRMAVTLMPSEKDVWFNFALSYFELGEYEYAAEKYRVITQVWPEDVRGFLFLAKAYIKNKEYDKAISVIKNVYPQRTKSPVDGADLIGSICEQGAYDKAKVVYDLVASINSKNKNGLKSLDDIKSSKCGNFVKKNECNDSCYEHDKN